MGIKVGIYSLTYHTNIEEIKQDRKRGNVQFRIVLVNVFLVIPDTINCFRNL